MDSSNVHFWEDCQKSVILANSAGMLAAFRPQEDGSLRRLERYPGTLPRALLWRVAPSRHQNYIPACQDDMHTVC